MSVKSRVFGAVGMGGRERSTDGEERGEGGARRVGREDAAVHSVAGTGVPQDEQRGGKWWGGGWARGEDVCGADLGGFGWMKKIIIIWNRRRRFHSTCSTRPRRRCRR